jgi:hypothetical protein
VGTLPHAQRTNLGQLALGLHQRDPLVLAAAGAGMLGFALAGLGQALGCAG